MASNPVEFLELSTDIDSYTLSFSLRGEQTAPIYTILTDAVNFRLSQIIDENELKVLGLTVRVDCFDFKKCSTGYVEMDTLYHGESISSLEAYLYDETSILRAKASCTLQYERENRVPAH